MQVLVFCKLKFEPSVRARVLKGIDLPANIKEEFSEDNWRHFQKSVWLIDTGEILQEQEKDLFPIPEDFSESNIPPYCVRIHIAGILPVLVKNKTIFLVNFLSIEK